MKPIEDVKTFADAGMNLQTDPRYLKANETGVVWNSIVDISADGGLGCLKNIKGTVNVFSLDINKDFELPEADFMAVGAFEDTERNAVIYHLCDRSESKNHSILHMFTKDFRCEWIIKALPILNYQSDPRHKISGETFGNLHYFTDNYENPDQPFTDYNPPRKINMVRATALYNQYIPGMTLRRGMIIGYQGKCWQYINDITSIVNPFNNDGTYDVGSIIMLDGRHYDEITPQILDRIKYPDHENITVAYATDRTRTSNFLNGKLFQFRTQFLYDDNEPSVFSPISSVPLPTGSELANGTYVKDISVNNCINVTFHKGSKEVYKVNLLVREGNDGVWRQVFQFNKYPYLNAMHPSDPGIDLPSITPDVYYTYKFYNDSVGFAVDQNKVNRLQDYVPQISKVNAAVEKGKLSDGNYVEGYDPTTIDVDLHYDQEIIDDGALIQQVEVTWPNMPYGDGLPWFYVILPLNIPAGAVVEMSIWRWFDSALDPNDGNPAPTIPSPIPQPPISFGYQVSVGESIHSIVQALITMTRAETGVNAMNTGTDNVFMIPYETAFNCRDHGKTCDHYWVNQVQCSIVTASAAIKSVKTGAIQYYGLQYFDRALRTRGSELSEKTHLYIPYLADEHQSTTNPDGTINWQRSMHKTKVGFSINHQPPRWAEYYKWVYLKSNIQWFLDFYVNVSDVESVVTTNGTRSHIKFNTGIQAMKESMPHSMIQNYVWQKGDRIRLLAIKDGGGKHNYYYPKELLDLEILGFQFGTNIHELSDDFYQHAQTSTNDFIYDGNGNKMLDDAKSRLITERIDPKLLTLGNGQLDVNVIFEIYRMKKQAGDETDQTYFEAGPMRPITNPHTLTRAHGGCSQNQVFDNDGTLVRPAQDIFDFGDCYAKFRFTGAEYFMCESMSYSDFYKSDVIDLGRPTIVQKDVIRRRMKGRALHSDLFLENSLLNGLSTVDQENHTSLLESFGSINYMKEVGCVLKTYQQFKTHGVYIGREGLAQAQLTGQKVVVSKGSTFGSVDPSEESWGTEFGEGCLKHNRYVYLYDIYNGAILRDAANGIEPISKYGIENFIKNLSESLKKSGLENINVYSAYDGEHDMVIFAFVDHVNPANNYTLGFIEKQNKWISFYNFTPDYMVGHNNVLTSFSGGVLWVHYKNEKRGWIYGSKCPQSVRVFGNVAPKIIKVWKSIGIMCNKLWSSDKVGDLFVPANETYPRSMVSMIPTSWFINKEGKLWSAMGRNMTTHSLTPSMTDLILGDELRGPVIQIDLRNESDDEVELFGVIINGLESKPTGING